MIDKKTLEDVLDKLNDSAIVIQGVIKYIEELEAHEQALQFEINQLKEKNE